MRKKKIRQKRISYLKLSDGLFLLVLMSMFFLLLIGVNVGAEQYQKHQISTIQESMEIVGANQKMQFETYINDKIKVLQSLATFPSIYNLQIEAIHDTFHGHSEALGFQQLFIMQNSGTAYYIEEDIYRSQKQQAFYGHVMNNDVFITEPFYGEYSTLMTLSVAIYNDKGTRVGALCGAIDLQEIQNVFAEYGMFLDGGNYLLNRNGAFLVANQTEKVHLKTSAFEDVNSDLSLITKAFTSKSNHMGEMSVDGVSYVAYAIYLPNYDWVMVQCVEKENVLRSLKYISLWTYIAYALVVLILICVLRIIIHWRVINRKVNTDSLTGCLSRASILNLMETFDAKKGKRITLIYMDLNKFKYINDTFGHDAGDDVLCIFSDVLLEVFGHDCYVGRMGGDEFVILAPDYADEIIELSCQKVQETLDTKSKELPFSYSIKTSYGYATRQARGPEKMNDLLTIADSLMYKCKEQMQ